MCFISIGGKIQKYECECYAIKNVHLFVTKKRSAYIHDFVLNIC